MKTGAHICILTYYWPPSGGPAVQRWLHYSALLVKAGYRVSVVTVDENYAQFPSLDYSLEKEIATEVKVYKTKTREIYGIYKKTVGRGQVPSSAFANESNPGPLKKIARFIRGNFFLPDPRRPWNYYAIKQVASIHQKSPIDLLITAGPPHSTHLSGKYLKSKFKEIKWIADFHDAWTDIIYYKQLYHTGIARWLDANMERKVLEQADGILAVGEEYQKRLLTKSNHIDSNKWCILRMAYDEKAFENGILPAIYLPGEPLKIIYTGTISDNYHPEILFESIRALKQLHPKFEVELHFAGILSENVRNAIVDTGLSQQLTEHGYLSHQAVISLLRSGNLLLLVNPHIEQERMVIPGKIYEYLASGVPILNITDPQAETAKIIASCQAGATFSRDQQAALSEWLWDVYSGKITIQPDMEAVKAYSREAQAGALIEFIYNL